MLAITQSKYMTRPKEQCMYFRMYIRNTCHRYVCTRVRSMLTATDLREGVAIIPIIPTHHSCESFLCSTGQSTPCHLFPIPLTVHRSCYNLHYNIQFTFRSISRAHDDMLSISHSSAVWRSTPRLLLIARRSPITKC